MSAGLQLASNLERLTSNFVSGLEKRQECWGKLVLIGGEDLDEKTPTQFMFHEGENDALIGRSNRCANHIIMRQYVSELHLTIRRHCLYENQKNVSTQTTTCYEIIDHSIYGTYLNDALIGKSNSKYLQNNDLISFKIYGTEKMTFIFRTIESISEAIQQPQRVASKRKYDSINSDGVITRNVRRSTVCTSPHVKIIQFFLEKDVANNNNPIPVHTSVVPSHGINQALQEFFTLHNLSLENCRIWIRMDGNREENNSGPRKLTSDITEISGSWKYLRDPASLHRLNVGPIDLMIEQRMKSATSFSPFPSPSFSWPRDNALQNWKLNLRVGDLLDGRDVSGVWYEATVSSLNLETVTIHFMGWGSEFDRELSYDELGTEIAPWNSLTANWRDMLKLNDGIDYLVTKDQSQSERKWHLAFVTQIDHQAGQINLKYFSSSLTLIEVNGVKLYGESICQLGTHVKPFYDDVKTLEITRMRESWNLFEQSQGSFPQSVIPFKNNPLESSTPSNSMKSNLENPSTCIICYEKPRNATFIHGKTGHICCCLQCAEMIYERNEPCPICRESISIVVENFHS